MPKWTDEQLEAINEEGKNIIVSAGAGSGKTAVLSERVLRKVSSGISINKLLILTFTNAAASEMKERIRKKLENLSLKQELALLDSAYIMTFDAYALSLVKKYYYLLNIDKDITIGEESIFTLKKEEYLDDIFNEMYESNNPLFIDFISTFCVKDDTDLKKMLLNIDASVDNYYEPSYLNEVIISYETLLLKYTQDIQDNLENLKGYVSGPYYEKISSSLSILLNANTYEEIKNNVNITLPIIEKGSEEKAKNIKEKISNTIKKLQKLTKYPDKEYIKNSLIKTKKYAIVITDILQKLESMMESFKHTKNIYTFTDIAKMAISILENNPRVSEEIKNSFQEILIDEYQDTSDLQDKFISLIENNNVYMVGDIKQSIYRFRNANPELFRKKYNTYAKGLNGLKIDLHKNFRSRKEVIDNINLIFNHIMDEEVGFSSYRQDHQMLFGNNTYLEEDSGFDSNMEVLTYELDKESAYNSSEIEAFTIAKNIKEYIQRGYKVLDKESGKLRPITYSDFCILIDRSKDFSTYKKILEYSGIPTIIYRDEPISDTADLQIIKNVFNLLKGIATKNYDKLFSFAFLSIGRSYLISYDDAYLFDIITNKRFYETTLYQKLTNILKDYETLTPTVIFKRFLKEFDVYNKIITIGDINAHTMVYDYFKDLLFNLESMGYTILEVTDYLNKIADHKLDIKYHTNKEESNACKIMTIHASKGLEFPICFYSGLKDKYNIKELTSRILYNKDIGLIMPFYDNGLHSSILKEINNYHYYQEEISERLRLFYVALTRAREKMILITPLEDFDSSITHNLVNLSDRLRYRSTSNILFSLENVLASYFKTVDLNTLNLTKAYKLSTQIKTLEEQGMALKVYDNPPITEELEENKHYSKESNTLYTTETLQNINFGLLCHRELENIDFKNPNYEYMNPLVADKIKAFIKTGILDNALNIYKEYEFVWEKEDGHYTGIIDLLIEYQDSYTIIDYKLKHTQDKAYLKQLAGYKEYIKMLTNKEVKTYLYSILDEKLEELNV